VRLVGEFAGDRRRIQYCRAERSRRRCRCRCTLGRYAGRGRIAGTVGRVKGEAGWSGRCPTWSCLLALRSSGPLDTTNASVNIHIPAGPSLVMAPDVHLGAGAYVVHSPSRSRVEVLLKRCWDKACRRPRHGVGRHHERDPPGPHAAQRQVLSERPQDRNARRRSIHCSVMLGSQTPCADTR